MRNRGTSLALLLPVLCATQSGCLVTEGIEFPEEENVAPLIFVRQGSPSPSPGPLRTEPGSELEFEVIVQDPNVTQPLEYSLLRNFDVDRGIFPVLDGALPATGDVERALDFRVPTSQLSAPPGTCVRLDLFATSSFDRVLPEPEVPGDLARITWLVAVLDDLEEPTTSVSLTECP